MNNLEKLSDLTGRILISAIFLVSGFGKISQYAGTQAFMASAGVPGSLLPLVIALEIGGALAIIVGYKTRWAAIALAGFSIVSALIFHANFADQIQSIMFLKNVAMAGGFLVIAARGAGTLSLDARAQRQSENLRRVTA
ncbi:MAG TPA: DoxX family protein [Nevskiaceae bacterium]|nr:DoxX family protein [Nevskiaceae bacterium]